MIAGYFVTAIELHMPSQVGVPGAGYVSAARVTFMPKSKVRKKQDYTINPTNRTPVKISAGPSPVWYVVLMLGFMVAGLLWLIIYYLAGGLIPVMADIGPWNFIIGFALMVVGLLMTMRWR